MTHKTLIFNKLSLKSRRETKVVILHTLILITKSNRVRQLLLLVNLFHYSREILLMNKHVFSPLYYELHPYEVTCNPVNNDIRVSSTTICSSSTMFQFGKRLANGRTEDKPGPYNSTLKHSHTVLNIAPMFCESHYQGY